MSIGSSEQLEQTAQTQSLYPQNRIRKYLSEAIFLVSAIFVLSSCGPSRPPVQPTIETPESKSLPLPTSDPRPAPTFPPITVVCVADTGDQSIGDQRLEVVPSCIGKERCVCTSN